MTFFSSSNHSLRRRPQDPFMHRIANDPYLDWLIIVIIAVIMSGVFIGAGLISYQDAQSRLLAPVVSNVMSPQRLLDSDSMSRILKTFGARADEQAALIKGYNGVADPSL